MRTTMTDAGSRMAWRTVTFVTGAKRLECPIRERKDVPVGQSDYSGAEGRSTRLTVEGTVREALPHAMYTVELDNGQRVTTHVAGSLKPVLIRLVPGDRVTIDLSPYDLSRGRITRRHTAPRK
jgi:translation initiation factor IF-1